MADSVVANGHVGNLANGADVGTIWGVLVLGGEKNRKSMLAESSPSIFQHIPLKQNPLGVLQFEVVFDHERVAFGTTDEAGGAGHPLPRFEEMVAPNLDVGGSGSGRAAAEENALARGLEEVIDDLVGAA